MMMVNLYFWKKKDAVGDDDFWTGLHNNASVSCSGSGCMGQLTWWHTPPSGQQIINTEVVAAFDSVSSSSSTPYMVLVRNVGQKGARAATGATEGANAMCMCGPPIAGGWSDWSAEECPFCSEGEANVTRTRTCDNPEPKFGGAQCLGETSITVICPGKKYIFSFC